MEFHRGHFHLFNCTNRANVRKQYPISVFEYFNWIWNKSLSWFNLQYASQGDEIQRKKKLNRLPKMKSTRKRKAVQSNNCATIITRPTLPFKCILMVKILNLWKKPLATQQSSIFHHSKMSRFPKNFTRLIKLIWIQNIYFAENFVNFVDSTGLFLVNSNAKVKKDAEY